MADFDIALANTLDWEGGFSDNPADPGGRTNHGITQSSYNEWRASQKLPPEDVKNIMDEEIDEFYLDCFWVPLRGGAINSQDVANKCFDVCVNLGLGGGTKIIQAACADAGNPTMVDGSPGPNTLASINKCDPVNLLVAIRGRLETYYRDLVAEKPYLAVFMKGWTRRAAS